MLLARNDRGACLHLLCSSSPLPPSPPAEKATASKDQARESCTDDGTGVTANCVHPGLVATGFNRSNGLLMDLGMTILRPVSRSPEKGAETLVWLATSPDVANVSGLYFFDQEQRLPSPEAQDTETARRLWEISERQCTVSGRSAEARS